MGHLSSRAAWVAALFASFVVVGCSCGGEQQMGADAGRDAFVGTSDASPDAGHDASAAPDVGSDVGMDAGSDGGTDAGSDSGVDGGMDAGSDAGPSCTNTLRDGDETGVDCGGPTCTARCAVGGHCAIDGDCASGTVCRVGVCIDTTGALCPSGSPPITTPGVGLATPTVFASDALMHGPGSLVADGSGGFYVQDAYGSGVSGDRILHVDTARTTTTLALTGGALCVVSQLARSGSDLLIYDTMSNALLRISAAGTVSNFSSVGGVGGGGNCTDSGVIGLLVRGDGSFVAASPGSSALYALSADGATRTTLLSPFPASWRLAPNDAGSILAIVSGVLVRVDLGTPPNLVTLRNLTPIAPAALYRDGAGAIYVPSGRNLLRVEIDLTVTLVARCFPGPLTDVLVAPASGGTGTSIYVTQYGTTIDAFDGDAIHELARVP